VVIEVRAKRLDAAASRLGALLHVRRWTVSLAESVTGGMIADALVAVPGSGEWLAGGVVAYMTRVKRSVLDVSADHVISAEAAREMALGVSKLLATDVAIATTGCAGPEAMDDEPVGSTWIAVATEGRAIARHYQFAGDPETIREEVVIAALHLVCQTLTEPEQM
jgi:PncC family amidohydrolase